MNPKTILLTLALLVSGNLLAQNWLTDLSEAQQQASEKNRNILLVFSGSDWCIPCMKLDRFIWQTEEFKNYADHHFILLRADFPKQKKHQLSQEQQNKNDQLAKQYNPQGYFPLVVILDKQGKVIGNTGYKNVSPAKYIELLNSIEK